jgi:hypothetical protein
MAVEQINSTLSLSLKNCKVSRLVPCINIFLFIPPPMGSCVKEEIVKKKKKQTNKQKQKNTPMQAVSGLKKNHMCRSQYWLIVAGRVCFQLTVGLPASSSLINTCQMSELNSFVDSTCPMPATCSPSSSSGLHRHQHTCNAHVDIQAQQTYTSRTSVLHHHSMGPRLVT